MLKERRIERRRDGTLRLLQIVDAGDGPEVVNVLVRLRPPLGYDATIEGTTTTLHFDFEPRTAGSELVVRFDEDTELTRALRKGIAENLDALFPVMAGEAD